MTESISDPIVDQRLRLKALHNLGIFTDLHPENRADLHELEHERYAMLEIDGGGFHIFWSLTLLNDMELVAGKGLGLPGDRYPLYKLFDVVTGASAGAITAALIGKEYNVPELEDFWNTTGLKIFYPYSNPLVGITSDLLPHIYLTEFSNILRLGYSALIGPLFNKELYRQTGRRLFGDESMEDLVKASGTGVLLSTTDVSTGYMDTLGSIPVPGFPDHPASWLNSRELLVRGIFEAAGSPPTLTQTLGPYIDAGFGVYDDPTQKMLQSLTGIDGLQFFPIEGIPPGVDRDLYRQALQNKYFRIQQKYYSDKMLDPNGPFKAAVMSVGTAISPNEILPTDVAQKQAMPWLVWLTYYAFNVYANSDFMQNQFLTDKIKLPWLDVRRYNMSFNAEVLRKTDQLGAYPESFPKIPGIRSRVTSDVTAAEMYFMVWCQYAPYIPFYQATARSTLRYMYDVIGKNAGGNPFARGLNMDLANFNPNMYIQDGMSPTYRNYYPARTEIESKLKHTLGSPDWIDEQPVDKPLLSYFTPPLPTLIPPFFQALPPYPGQH